jgi:hypothetical protein
MRVAVGKVVAGKVVVEGEPLQEGATVTVLAPENDESLELSSEDEAELLAALEEASAGRLVSSADLLRELGRSG